MCKITALFHSEKVRLVTPVYLQHTQHILHAFLADLDSHLFSYFPHVNLLQQHKKTEKPVQVLATICSAVKLAAVLASSG